MFDRITPRAALLSAFLFGAILGSSLTAAVAGWFMLRTLDEVRDAILFHRGYSR